MKKVITGTIHQGNFEALKQIMRDQSSCRRHAYQRIHKDNLIGNDIVKICKLIYMDKLNQRYIQDAVLKAKTIKKDGVIFGGKKNWKKLISGLITKKEWQEIRDSELYSRGDRTKKGNPNIRVLRTTEGYKLRIGLAKPREFLTFKLYIPKKFQHDFDLHNECYDVRIKHKSGKFYVYIGLDIPEITPIYKFSDGALGIDTNPDGLAVVETDKEGNLVRHQYLESQKLKFARHNKRKNDIEALALKIVNQAIVIEKGIVIEDLKFNDKKSFKNKKFNRMKHNFIYSQFLRAIERRAIKDGVEIKKINPAFTSIAGVLKYQKMYSLNRHTAAALIIARRGMGICEKIRVRLMPLENKKLNLAGRGFKIALTEKAYSYFKRLFRVIEVKVPGLTAPCLNST
jgi:IS605 OrfB family transposase